MMKVGGAALLIIAGILALSSHLSRPEAVCFDFDDASRRLDCLVSFLREEVARRGPQEAMQLFGLFYDRYPDFAYDRCHFSAHLVGDETYIKNLSEGGRITDIPLTPETYACFFGFVVGLLEHHFQNDSSDIPGVCAAVESRWGQWSGYLRALCFHAAGHGFVLAEIDTQGSHAESAAILASALESCAALGVSEEDTEHCSIGTFFNVFEFDPGGIPALLSNLSRHTRLCAHQADNLDSLCFEVLGQKVGIALGDDIHGIRALTDSFPEDARSLAFTNGIAASMRQFFPSKDYDTLLARCASEGPDYLSSCVVGAVRGLFELGAPRREWAEALRFCKRPDVAEQRALCERTLAGELRRYYPERIALRVCAVLGSEASALCRERSTTVVHSYFSGEH